MIRVRTIKQTADYLKELDNTTNITEKVLRNWCKTGVLPCVRSGRKYLICLETLEKFLRGDLE